MAKELTESRRTRYTRKAMQDALIDLMRERPLGSITIKAAFLYVGEVLVLRYMLDDPAHSNTAQDLTSEPLTVKML